MNYSTERIERVLDGTNEHLSTEDLSMMVMDLVKEIHDLKDRVNSLEGELQDVAQHSEGESLYGGMCDDY